MESLEFVEVIVESEEFEYEIFDLLVMSDVDVESEDEMVCDLVIFYFDLFEFVVGDVEFVVELEFEVIVVFDEEVVEVLDIEVVLFDLWFVVLDVVDSEVGCLVDE